MTAKEYNDTVAKAQGICARCSVQAECEEEGKEMEHGIWGGVVK
jgi:hypothetical protein